MKNLIIFLSFVIGMIANAQVSQTQVFTTTEEISFVSDDGGGMYTVSGPGGGSDGFLAIYDENMPTNSRWEVKNFPPDPNYGSYHNAETESAVTINGLTFAAGLVATSNTSSWEVVRKYNGPQSSVEKLVKDLTITLYTANGSLYAAISVYSNSDLLNTGWNLPGEGMYLAKFNKQDLSLDWSYRVCSTWNNTEWRIQTQDNLISTNKAYRYAVQQLPNGNIAVTVSRVISGNPGAEYQLWEFDPATGQKLGVIDDSYTDYDRNGTAEMQYRFHRWKVVDGVLFHEFWQDPNNSQDAQVGHWEKLEVPSWTPGGSTPWDSANLQVTAVSDWSWYDTMGVVVQDFSVEADGTINAFDRYLTKNLEPISREHVNLGLNDIRDRWQRQNGELMLMTLHGLYKNTYTPQYTEQPGLNSSGVNVVEVHENELYLNGTWTSIQGEASLVLSSLPNIGDNPKDLNFNWWVIPSGYHWVGNTEIAESHRPGEDGLLYFRIGMMPDGVTATEENLRITLYTSSQIGGGGNDVAEQEINGLKLYPNPVQDYLTVTVEADVVVDAVRVYNMSGVAVKEVSDGMRVYMGNLPAGVYVVEVTAADKISRRKVIKK